MQGYVILSLLCLAGWGNDGPEKEESGGEFLDYFYLREVATRHLPARRLSRALKNSPPESTACAATGPWTTPRASTDARPTRPHRPETESECPSHRHTAHAAPSRSRPPLAPVF